LLAGSLFGNAIIYGSAMNRGVGTGERSSRWQWVGKFLLVAGFAVSGVGLRRVWLGAVTGGTVPIRTRSLMALALAALLVGSALFRRRSSPEWRLFVARLVLVTASLCMALLVGEIALRAFFQWRLRDNSIARLRDYESGKEIRVTGAHPLAAIVRLSANAHLVYELRPNLDLEFGHRRVQTNRDGMRRKTDPEPERKPNTVRILGIGDSGMFGWNVEQGEDYLSVLESNLRHRDDGVLYEVLNLAVPGYNTQLEVEAFRDKGAKYHPDVVIVGWCVNDFGLPYFVTQKHDFFRTDFSYLETVLFHPADLEHLVSEDVGPTGSWKPDAVRDFLLEGTGEPGVRGALRSLREMSRAQGFRVLVFGPLDRKIRRIATELGIDFYNTYAEIPKRLLPADWDVHFMHPRAEGHRALAEHIEHALERRGWLMPRDLDARPNG
jgi:lysophospholipase L1-like esterase